MSTVNLTTNNENGSQRGVKAVKATIDYTDRSDGETLVSGDINQILQLPDNVIVTGVFMNVVTEFDSETSAVLDVGDGGSATRYKDDLDLTTAGATAVTSVSFYYAAGDTIDAAITIVGATTEGVVDIIVEYIDLNEKLNYNA